MWIAEIGRARRERVRLHRLPIGIGQIRGGFHHHRLLAGPADVEAELVGLHTEAAVAGLNGGQPERGRNEPRARTSEPIS